jgi:uncharacterized protein involved in exopolysaccharide biosynthesis
MDLRGALRSIALGWYFPALGVLIALGAATFIHTQATPVYEARATYVVFPYSAPDDVDVAESVKTLDSTRSRSIMTTLVEIVESHSVRTDAAAATGLDPATLEEYEVIGVVLPEANLIASTVRGPDPVVAVQFSEAVGEAAIARFVAFYRIYDAEVLDAAPLPTTPSNRGLIELGGMATILGLLVGSAFALLRDPEPGRRRSTMHGRLGAYGNVTEIREHDRYQRVG